MAKTIATEEPAKPKAKRTILSSAERIEKAKADLAALELKEQGKAKAKLGANEEALAKAEAAVTKAQAKVDELKAERLVLQELAGVTVGEALPDSV